MAKQTIGIGSSANDGTGDPLRSAFTKINANFTELYGASGEDAIVDDTTPQLGGNLDVQSFQLTSSVTNGNVTLNPNGTGTVELSANTNVTGNLTATGNIVANGNINLGNAAGDQTKVVGVFEADNLQIDGTTMTSTITNGDVTIQGNGTGQVQINKLTVDSNVLIVDNAIATTVSNSNLQLNASGTGSVEITKADINGGAIDGTIIGAASAAAITGTTVTASTGFVGPINGIIGAGTPAAITGTTITANTRFIGAHDGTVGATTPATGVFTTLTANTSAVLDGVTVTDNTISTNASNANLELSGNSSGSVKIMDSLIGTFDTVQTGTITVTGIINADNVQLKDNAITTNASNANLEISANGTGVINVQTAMTTLGFTTTGSVDITGDLDVDTLNINGSTISSTATNGGINLTPNGTGSVTLGGQYVAVTNTLSATDIEVGTALDLNSSASIRTVVTNDDIRLSPQGTGLLDFTTTPTQATVGSAGGASALPAQPTGYLKLKLGGNLFIVPYYAAS